MRFSRLQTIEIGSEGQGADNRKREIVNPIGDFDNSIIFVGLFLESVDNSLHKLLHRRAEEIEFARIERWLQYPSKEIVSVFVPRMSSIKCRNTSH